MLSCCVYKSHYWEYDRPDLHRATLCASNSFRLEFYSHCLAPMRINNITELGFSGLKSIGLKTLPLIEGELSF
jgi:hypothetical protein